MAYEITSDACADGRDTARCVWGGTEYTAATDHGAICALARKLVSDGAPDGPWRTATLSGPSLHRMATLTVRCDDRALRFEPYAPHHLAVVPPVLAGVLDAARMARAHARESARMARAGILAKT